MDLRLCPSCRQSVLDDDVETCPFCGAAMDGSGGGKKPAPPAKPAAKPAAPRPTASPSGESAGSTSKPIQAGMRAGKTTADDDDPFGTGSEAQYAGVIQALAKPEKGKLHRVVCPMCEKPGFVSKSAIGKQVRCANEKCMVPVFTVPDPDAAKSDKPTRRPGASGESPKAEVSTTAKRRNPLVIYAVVGGVLLLLAIPLVQYLNRPPEGGADLNRPIAGLGGVAGGVDVVEDEPAVTPTDAVPKAKDPVAEAKRIAERMIQAARQQKNRDKALARRLSGDLYFQLGDPANAAKEFGQLLQVNRNGGFMKVEPLLREYWKQKSAGQSGAADLFRQATSEIAGLPTEGKLAAQSAISLAAALVAEGSAAEANSVLQKFQKDRQVVANRDLMSGSAWFNVQDRMLELKSSPLAAVDVYAWNDPLRTAVAAQLASRKRWTDAMTWASEKGNLREASDSFAVIAQLSTLLQATPAEQQAIVDAAGKLHPLIGLRTQAVLAAELKSVDRLNAIAGSIEALPAAGAMELPGFAAALRTDLPSSQDAWLAASAASDFGRAAAACGDMAKAELAVRRITQSLLSVAPSVPATRKAVDANDTGEAEVRRQLAAAMSLTSDDEVTTTFRNYRRKVDQFAQAAEERRLLLIQRLARIARSGGTPAIQTVLKDATSGLLPELAVDPLSNIIAIASVRSGQTLPEITGVDPALRIAVPARATALSEVTISPVLSRGWGQIEQANLIAALSEIEKGGELPGLREAVANEIAEFAAMKADSPEKMLAAVASMQNPVWREELYLNVGMLLARRGMAEQAEKWLDSASTMPATEQATLLYGIAVGMLQTQAGGSAAPGADAKPSAP